MNEELSKNDLKILSILSLIDSKTETFTSLSPVRNLDNKRASVKQYQVLVIFLYSVLERVSVSILSV